MICSVLVQFCCFCRYIGGWTCLPDSTCSSTLQLFLCDFETYLLYIWDLSLPVVGSFCKRSMHVLFIFQDYCNFRSHIRFVGYRDWFCVSVWLSWSSSFVVDLMRVRVSNGKKLMTSYATTYVFCCTRCVGKWDVDCQFRHPKLCALFASFEARFHLHSTSKYLCDAIFGRCDGYGMWVDAIQLANGWTCTFYLE